MKEAKEYTIIKHHRGRETEFTGTLEYLVNDVFGYTLECGASWSHERGCKKVNRNPKTIRALIMALDNAVHNTQGSNYDPDWYELKED